MKLSNPVLRASVGLIVFCSLLLAQPVNGTGNQIEKIFIAPMSHLDIGFTGTQRRIAQSYKRKIDSLLDQLDRYPDYRWTVESFWQLQQWLQRTEDRKKVQKFLSYVREGRIELSASYVNAHTGFMAGEVFQRMVYPSYSFAREHNLRLQTFIQNDVPGFSRDLPAVLANAGLDYFIAGVNDKHGGGVELEIDENPFYWKAPDGSKVLTWVSDSDLLKGYWGGLQMLWGEWIADVPFPRQIEELIRELENKGYPYDAVMLIRAMDNEAPRASSLFQRVKEWGENHKVEMVVSTPGRFMDHLVEKYGDEFPTFSGEWARWESNKAGSPVTSARTRWIHENLPRIETTSSLMSITTGNGYPARTFKELYESTLVADAHASHGQPSWPGKLAGRQLKEINRTVVEISKKAIDRTKELLDHQLNSYFGRLQGENPRIVVFNSTGLTDDLIVRAPVDKAFIRDGYELVELSTGETVNYEIRSSGPRTGGVNPWHLSESDKSEFYQVVFRVNDAPAFGFKTYELRPGDQFKRSKHQNELPEEPRAIENDYYRVEITEEGTITSIFDKEENKEIVQKASDYRFGRLYLGYHSDQFRRKFHGTLLTQSVEKIERETGPVSSRLVIRYSDGPLLEARISLYSNEDWVDLEFTVDRASLKYVPYEKHSAYLYLPFPVVPGEESYVEGVESVYGADDFMPGARTGRTKSRGVVEFESDSGGSIFIGHRQSFLSTMAGMHNRMKGGYPPRLPSSDPVWIAVLLQKFDETKAMEGVIEFDPEPDTSDVMDYQYRIGTGSPNLEELTRFRQAFLSPPFPWFLRPGEGSSEVETEESLMEIEGPCELLTLKKAEVSEGYIARLKGTSKIQGECSLSFSRQSDRAWITTGTEEVLSELPTNPIEIDMAPDEIKTIKVTFE